MSSYKVNDTLVEVRKMDRLKRSNWKRNDQDISPNDVWSG